MLNKTLGIVYVLRFLLNIFNKKLFSLQKLYGPRTGLECNEAIVNDG
jgi:hypothetical protein